MHFAATVACTMVMLASVASAGQTPGQASAGPGAPRTPDGHPDLQGTYDYRTATPLERPRDMAQKATFTEDEAAAFEVRNKQRLSNIVAVHPPDWLDYGDKLLADRRTSLITDPATGRVPPLTPAARARQAAENAGSKETDADGPEQRSLQERCLVFGAGPPLLPGPYNNTLQIIQTPSAIVLMNEMIHDARIVPMGAGTDGPSSKVPLTRWLGDSRGRWDGDTLVIETSGFDPRVTFRGSDERLRVVERLRRVDGNTLDYEFTIDNPTAFTAPWTARFPLTRTTEQMYEYACHEGNYGLLDILKGARFVERR